jgi:hypothetical protein
MTNAPDDDPVLLTVATPEEGVTVYEGPVRSLGWEDQPLEPGERPRVFIAGRQRSATGSIFAQLLRFHDATQALLGAGYSGVWVRLTVFATLGPTTDPTGEDQIDWQSHVRRNMQHCVGVALLDSGGDTAAVAIERQIACDLGKPVWPLSWWLENPAIPSRAG